MTSLDWLSVVQVEPAGVPWVGSRRWVAYEVETGEVEVDRLQGLGVEGSFSSSVLVRSDGARVEVSGNPSRWEQPDNVFGLGSLGEGLDLWSALLVAQGLNPLRREATATHQLQRNEAVVRDDVSLQRVDLARNYVVGRGREAAFLRWCEGQSVGGNLGHRYADGTAVDWRRGSRRVYCKAYAKGPELRRHAMRQAMRHSSAWLRHVARLADWCDEVGLVRVEVELKAMYLRDQGLNRAGSWAETTMQEQHDRHRPAAWPSVEVLPGGPTSLAAELEELGASARWAAQCEAWFHAWMGGQDLAEAMSRAQWYRVRRALLAVGVDIRAAPAVRRIRPTVEEVGVAVAVPPEWYQDSRREAVVEGRRIERSAVAFERLALVG